MTAEYSKMDLSNDGEKCWLGSNEETRLTAGDLSHF